MNTIRLTNVGTESILIIDNETASALAVLLGSVIDLTEENGLETLYNALADAGFAETGDDLGISVEVEDNADYDPEDEDDTPVFIRVIEVAE